MFQSLGLVMDRVNAGWEVHSAGERGIIFPSFNDAVQAVAEWAGAQPGDVTVRRDGTIIVHRETDPPEAGAKAG